MARRKLTNIQDAAKSTRDPVTVPIGDDFEVDMFPLRGGEIERWRKGNNLTGKRKLPGTEASRLIAMCIRDPQTGRPQFTIDEVTTLLAEADAADTIKLEQTALKLCGLLDEDVEEMDEDDLLGNVGSSPTESHSNIGWPSHSAGEL